MLEESLQEIGLNRRESICYVALLEIGSSKVGNIVKKTEIPSSKIYEILDKLMRRGLVSYVIKNNVKWYQAVSPNSLISYFEEKKKKLEQILPELLLKQKFSKHQNVELYEGQKAIFTLFTNIIADAKSKELYLVFSMNEENKSPQTNLFFKNLAVRRKEKKLDVRLLKNIKHYTKEKHTKVKLRYTTFNLPQGTTIFRNYVILLSWTESPVAIKIESEIIANQQREFFLDLWKQAKH
ncbi:MAG: helix-turn-helix domain-containing protein [Candidatus Woesearchaeota archaeon]|jgi:sugar-specific transcriptional regulator TrmB